MTTFEPYADRCIEFFGVQNAGSARIKLYSVVFGDSALDIARFADGLQEAIRQVPMADISHGRPGLGFAILHQGRAGDYIVVSWWDRENELPTLVYVREGNGWRKAMNGESFCVWDLQIMWHERQAYVKTVLGGGDAADVGPYLDDVKSG